MGAAVADAVVHVLGLDAGQDLHGWAVLAHSRDRRPRWVDGGHDEAPGGTHTPDRVALEVIDPADGWQPERVRSLLRVAEHMGRFAGHYQALGVPVVRATARQWRRVLGVKLSEKNDPQVAELVRRLVDGVPAEVSGHALDAAGVALAVCLGWRGAPRLPAAPLLNPARPRATPSPTRKSPRS